MIKPAKTGLIYDPRMTEHKSKRKHPQRPQRVKFIMRTLQQKFYTSHPMVEYLSTINRIVTDQNIKLVHPEKYIKHVTTLWPKTSHRSDLTVLDTYFNEKSEKCAKLAIGGVLDGIDKIMAGDWRNGFACVRPPGHHSGGRHTINGFCVYNNVAIGARYLLQHHKVPKVAIVDWDVHHGDGTQHVFQKQPNIMLISIHRYDRGTFYPSNQFADVRNQGQGAGLGSKINLPLDFVDEGFKEYKFQAPGDNQYIYLYHRVIEPILTEFNPDFILVSSGFDAARGDPLGGFTVTPNGYYYMTKRLTEFKKPMLVVLEGGYNLESISLSAEAVMRALIGQEKFPQPITIDQHQIKNKCSLPEPIHQQIDHIVEVLSKNWPCLKQKPQLVSYTELIKANKDRVFGIVTQQSSSSSSQEQQQDNVSQTSERSTNSQSSSSSGHQYNTRSKKRDLEKEMEKQIEAREMEKEKREWEKQMEKMKKREEKVVEVVGQVPLKPTNKKQQKAEKEVKQVKEERKDKDMPKVEPKALKAKKKSQKQSKKQKQQSSQQQHNDGSVIKQFYFAAGHLQKFKNFSLNSPTVQKLTYPEQVQFYQHMTFQKQFAPKYYGKQGQDVIIIENLLYQQVDPIVIDVKMSRQSKNAILTEQRRLKEQRKEEKSTTDQYGFRISGYTTPEYKEGGLLEQGAQSINKILVLVVTQQNRELFCNYLKKLAEALQKSERRYYASSILLIKGPKKSEIRWVDFHYWHDTKDGPDVEMIRGVENLEKFIRNLQLP